MPSARSSSASKIVPQEGLTFDDVLLLPNESAFKRGDVDLATALHPKLKLKLPVISSPMDTVTETPMAIAMAKAGGIGIIHRNLTVEKQRRMVQMVKGTKVKADEKEQAALDGSGRLLCGAAVGAGSDLEERIDALVDAEADAVVVDSGHGHSRFIMDAVKLIRKRHGKKIVIIAGNVATAAGAKALISAGADVLRVGVGPGSICTTRIITGMGVPQLTALLEVAKACKGSKATFIADGGIKQMGDMAKALATGASAVMLGSMLAGHNEAPGEEVQIDGKTFKQYRGMGSIGAMQKGGAERYGQDHKTEAKKLIAEGVEGLVESKGDVHQFLFQSGGSLRSAFYYLGSKNLKEFHQKAKFICITPASMRESHPHTISVVDTGSNYML
jgi:IMP dehydrogenase